MQPSSPWLKGNNSSADLKLKELLFVSWSDHITGAKQGELYFLFGSTLLSLRIWGKRKCISTVKWIQGSQAVFNTSLSRDCLKRGSGRPCWRSNNTDRIETLTTSHYTWVEIYTTQMTKLGIWTENSRLDRKMPIVCAVIGCTNRHATIRIPKVVTNQGPEAQDLSERRRREWIRQIGREDITFTSATYQRICKIHFVTGEN